MNPKEIAISDFYYELPENRIAMHPLPGRDQSRLLIYREGRITDSTFRKIPEHLPSESLLVFNNTRVINARIRFTKTTGAAIEIFLLEPWGQVNEYNSVMTAHKISVWKCMVGGAAKWKNEKLQKNISSGSKNVLLNAVMKDKLNEAFIIEFTWDNEDVSFAEILESTGDIPLPPYIKRKSEEEDLERYQTIFAIEKGSVAAPTAGLHFTGEILQKLKKKGIGQAYVTLHVGAGTFKPVKADLMKDHEMHSEYIDVSSATIKSLMNEDQRLRIAVGTTALRTLESLYWLGIKVLLNPELQEIRLNQWDVYEQPLYSCKYSRSEALSALLSWMRRNNKTRIFTQTQLMIAPGYTFRMANALITNFHQPQSTLLLLVAAAVGTEWKELYKYALDNEYRFLSYGDASLIFIKE